MDDVHVANLHIPAITAVTAGVLIIVQMLLALLVASARRKNRQSLGDGGNADVLRAMRRHGNLAENAAIFVAGFALLEMIEGSSRVLAVLCAVMVAGRLSHAFGLSQANTVNGFRVGGIIATVGVGLVLGMRLLAAGLQTLPPLF